MELEGLFIGSQMERRRTSVRAVGEVPWNSVERKRGRMPVATRNAEQLRCKNRLRLKIENSNLGFTFVASVARLRFPPHLISLTALFRTCFSIGSI